jgi:hypothetical protein
MTAFQYAVPLVSIHHVGQVKDDNLLLAWLSAGPKEDRHNCHEWESAFHILNSSGQICATLSIYAYITEGD